MGWASSRAPFHTMASKLHRRNQARCAALTTIPRIAWEREKEFAHALGPSKGYFSGAKPVLVVCSGARGVVPLRPCCKVAA